MTQPQPATPATRRQKAAASVGGGVADKRGFAISGGALGTALGALASALSPDIGQEAAAQGGAFGALLGLFLRPAIISVGRALGLTRAVGVFADATSADSEGGAALTGGELRSIVHAGVDDLLDRIDGIGDETEFGQVRDRLAEKGVALGVLYEGDLPDAPSAASVPQAGAPSTGQ